MSGPDRTPEQELLHRFLGFRVSQAIYAVTELGIADHLVDGPRTVAELASAVGAHAPSLSRVLRLLAGDGIFAETDDGRFALTPLAQPLRAEVPGSLRPLVRGMFSEAVWQGWGRLLHSVRTGEPAFAQVHGVDFFTYVRTHPDEAARFDELMSAYTVAMARAIAAAYGFTPFTSIVDVGGGRGALIIGLLDAHPQLRGIVFDHPAVAADAQHAIEAARLGHRAEAVGGSFFVSVPTGGEVYLLKWVLHDWDDEHCLTILRACRHAMPSSGRLLVIELLIPSGNGPSFAKSQDVNMLATLGGWERTEAEYRALLGAAGFTLARAIPALDELYVMEAIPN